MQLNLYQLHNGLANRIKRCYFQVDGRRLPRKRHRIYNGELTLENLRKSDHGVYECVVSNEVIKQVVMVFFKLSDGN